MKLTIDNNDSINMLYLIMISIKFYFQILKKEIFNSIQMEIII